MGCSTKQPTVVRWPVNTCACMNTAQQYTNCKMQYQLYRLTVFVHGKLITFGRNPFATGKAHHVFTMATSVKTREICGKVVLETTEQWILQPFGRMQALLCFMFWLFVNCPSIISKYIKVHSLVQVSVPDGVTFLLNSVKQEETPPQKHFKGSTQYKSMLNLSGIQCTSTTYSASSTTCYRP